MAVTISAAWTFDTRPQNGKYSYVPKFQDYNSWTVQAASYGTQGGAEIHIDLHNAPFTDLLTQARRGKIVSTLRLNTNAPAQLSDYLFSGYVDKIDFSFNKDDGVLHLRDTSAALMESTVKSRSFQQTSVSDLISELTLGVNIQPDLIVQITQQVGYYFSGTSGMSDHRSSAWDLIQRLATETENVAFCTPQGLFYFGPRERPGVPPLTLNWSYTDDTNDFISLDVEHEPLRNSVFFVIVQGHTPHNGANVTGTACYVNESVANDVQHPSGIFEGLSLQAAQDLFGDDLQVYNFNDEGLTAAGVQSKATSHALDIQGHEFVVKATVLGSTRFRIADPLVIQGTGQPAIDGRRFTITGIEHSLAVAEDGDVAPGFVTHLTLWASGAPVTAMTGVQKSPPPAVTPQPDAPLQPQPDSPEYDPYSICKDLPEQKPASLTDYNPNPVNYVERD